MTGAEIQSGNWDAAIGIPTCIGLKYFVDLKSYRWFFSIHAMYYDFDDDENIDDILYN